MDEMLDMHTDLARAGKKLKVCGSLSPLRQLRESRPRTTVTRSAISRPAIRLQPGRSPLFGQIGFSKSSSIGLEAIDRALHGAVEGILVPMQAQALELGHGGQFAG